MGYHCSVGLASRLGLLGENFLGGVGASRDDGDRLDQSDSLITIGHDGRMQRERGTS